MTSPDTPNTGRSPAEAPFLVFSWLFVALPLAWGISRTVLSAIPLFTK